MKQDLQLKLQAYLDGELPDGEAADVRELIARDREAQELVAELANTNAALTGHEAEVRLPESREFYWSKIKREIARLETPAAVPKQSDSWFGWAKRRWLPMSGLAAASCAAVLFMLLSGSSQAQLAEMELNSKEMGAYTFRDQKESMTMIWFYNKADDTKSAPATAGANLSQE